MTRITTSFCFITALTITSQAQLSGTYTVGGTSPNYATLSAAFTALMSSGASGNVTFNIRPGTYTAQYSLGAVPGSPGFIMVKSETNDAADVTLAFDAAFPLDNHIIEIEETDNLIFQALTFHPLNLDRARAINFFTDANLLQIIDCVFIGSQNPSTSSYFDRILVQCDQVNAGSTANPDDVIIDGCTFLYGNEAIDLNFSGLGGQRSQGLIISDNTFTDQVGAGVVINAAVGQFEDNLMTTTVGNSFYGLSTNYFDGGSQVRRNVFQLNSTVFGTTGMSVGNTQSTTGNMISNNMITVDGPGENIGLGVVNLWDMKVVHNSVAVLGGLSSSVACHHFSNFADGQDALVRNNIFSNHSGGPALKVNFTGNIATEDHNDLFTTGATVASIGGTNYTTIAAYQAGTSDGAGDVKLDPAFPFLPDLHLNSCVLDGLGQYFFVVASDIDGDARANPACDMGADEFTYSGSATITVNVLSSDLPLTLTAGSGSGYQWNTGATTQSISVGLSGPYACTFTDVNGCNYTIYYTVTVDFNTAVPEVAPSHGAMLFPNPAHLEFFLPGDRAGWTLVTLLDMNGRIAQEWNANARFALGGIAGGLYTVRLALKDGSSMQERLVVE